MSKRFEVRYREMVYYIAEVDAKDEEEARSLVKAGMIVDLTETDSALYAIDEVKLV